jgi:hypothetical protein
VNAHGRLARVLARRRDWEAALEAYRTILAIDPGNSVAQDLAVATGKRADHFREVEEHAHQQAADTYDLSWVGLSQADTSNGRVRVPAYDEAGSRIDEIVAMLNGAEGPLPQYEPDALWSILMGFNPEALTREEELQMRLDASRDDGSYYSSSHWRTLARRMKQEAGLRCVRCGGRLRLAVHHHTYERLGREKEQDLEVLCEECHLSHHPQTPRLRAQGRPNDSPPSPAMRMTSRSDRPDRRSTQFLAAPSRAGNATVRRLAPGA